MPEHVLKSVAIFTRPFRVPSLDEELPAGEYLLETEITPPKGSADPDSWRASVVIHLQPRTAFPGLTRSLTVPLAQLDAALARDRASGLPLLDYFVQSMLDDPLVRLVMESDGVSEAELRRWYGAPGTAPAASAASPKGRTPP